MTVDRRAAVACAKPEDVAFAILSRLFPDERVDHERRAPHQDGVGELLSFQRRGITRATHALEKWRFVLLCDDVGLGKTHMGVALLRRSLRSGLPVLLVIPAALRSQWTSRLRTLRHDRRIHVLTHGELSRGSYSDALLSRAGLIIVDEAHAFRSDHAKRYGALTRLAHRRQVCLITATPINNSVFDLYSLLRLSFADDAFARIGIASLHSLFSDIDSSRVVPHTFRILLREVMIRRTRRDIEDEVQAASSRLRFPRLAPPIPVRFDPDRGCPGSHRAILHEIDTLSFDAIAPASAGLIRYLLLKRLASSPAALAATTRSLMHYHRDYIEAVDEGLLLRTCDRTPRVHGDSQQLALRPLILRPLRPDDGAATLKNRVQSDLNRLRSILRVLDQTSRFADQKLHALRGLTFDTLRAGQLLIFTEFRETASYLWMQLRNAGGVAMIHGGGAWLGASSSSRTAVVHRFAPAANQVRIRHERERVRVLIATDVLAEGLNLQDCAHVLSYDLPWNPVRIRQRVGRINRMGSPHTTVFAYNFLPDRDLEDCLAIVARLRMKSHAIALTIGDDEPVFSDGAPPDPAQPIDASLRQDEFLRRWIRTAGAPACATGADCFPIAWLLDSGSAITSGGVCLIVEERPETGVHQRAFEVRGTRIVELDPAAVAAWLLENPRSHTARVTDPGDPCAVVERAARRLFDRLERVDVGDAAPLDTKPGSSQRRILAQHIFAAASAIPGGPDAAQAARAEEVIAALDRPLTLYQEHAVRDILHSGATDFDTVTALASALLAEAPRCPSPESGSPQLRRVIGAVLLGSRRLTHLPGSAKILCSK